MPFRLRNRWRFLGPGDDGRDRWNWEAFLHADQSEDLTRVEYVEYILHPTFPNPIRTITSPDGGFVLKSSGWGSFELRAIVQTKDGERIPLTHQIQLNYEPEEGVSNGLRVPLLDEVPLEVSENRVGVSYSGAGPLLLIELGIAQAFIDLKIVPVAVAGVSAGSIAATAHAFDPVGGTAIKAVAEALPNLGDRRLGLSKAEIVSKVLGALVSVQRLPMSLGDNGPIRPMMQAVFKSLVERPDLTVADFGRDGRADLFIGATDRIIGKRYWFPESAEIADALVASSAIPGVFPPRTITIEGHTMLFVDGAVAQNQPLSRLVLDADCGTVYACGVSYDGVLLTPPADFLENALTSTAIISHESLRVEQRYVELKFQQAGKGVVHHIHPEGPFGIKDFNFTAQQVQSVMALACQQTKEYILHQGWLPPGEAAPAVAPVLADPASRPVKPRAAHRRV